MNEHRGIATTALRVARGLFRLWIVGSALFVIVVAYYAYSGYSEIKAEFDAAASKPQASILATDANLADWVGFLGVLCQMNMNVEKCSQQSSSNRPTL